MLDSPAMKAVWAWMLANPELPSFLFALFLKWVYDNIKKRPPPDPPTGWKMMLWQQREKVMLMPWDRWFGKLKWTFKVTPYLELLREGETDEETIVAMAPKVAKGQTGETPKAEGRELPPAAAEAVRHVRDATATLPLPSSRRPGSSGSHKVVTEAPRPLPRPSERPPER